MRSETIHNLQIPKIGFGTWQIGGRGSPDPESDEKSILALRSALELGYTHFDTAEGYAAGHCEELVGQVIREMGVRREDLFITTKVSPEHLAYDDALRSCENSLRRLGIEYVDLYLIHWPKVGMRLEETFGALNKLVRQGKVRHLGVSNFNLKQLKQSAALCETPLLTNQVSYSIPDRTYVKNGVLGYCQENEILLTAYSPVKRRNIKSNQALAAIAKGHGAMREQIALAWLAMQPRVITIPMSFNPQHQAENFAAGELVLSEEEMERLG
jgi:diketogulonate reductase-like aldo/keto reductase